MIIGLSLLNEWPKLVNLMSSSKEKQQKVARTAEKNSSHVLNMLSMSEIHRYSMFEHEGSEVGMTF